MCTCNPPQAERWGTKPAAIVDHLRGVLAEPDSRAIVFSAFDHCLTLLKSTFTDAGITAARCEGDAAARHQAIAAFSDTSRPTGPRVLLLSSKHNASGTNLQCANHVVFVEPPGTNTAHSLAVETQAILLRVRVEARVRARARFGRTSTLTLTVTLTSLPSRRRPSGARCGSGRRGRCR